MTNDDRLLPNDLDAEKAVLGAILVNAALFERVTDRLVGADFFRRAHRAIFESMVTLDEQRSAIDPLTLGVELKRRGDFDEVGGPAYIASLTAGVPRSVNIVQYAVIVKEAATRRRVITLANQMMADAYAAERPAADIVTDADRGIIALQRGSEPGRLVDLRATQSNLIDDIQHRAHHRGELSGIDTGFSSINDLTFGWQRGDMIVIAARPSIGKSVFVLNTAIASGRQGKRIAIFSLEMRRRQVEYRILSSLSGVPLDRLLGGFLGEQDYERVAAAVGIMHEVAVFVDDRGGQTVWDIRSACRRLRSEGGLDLVVVDYVQLMPGTLDRRGATRNDEMTDISRRLKALADEVSVPVLVLSQLNRGSATRSDKRPILSDLRECLATGEEMYDAQTGRWIAVEDLARGTSLVPLGLGRGNLDQYELAPGRLAGCWSTGIQPCFTVKTKSGRRITATANHPFRRLDGWVSLSALRAGDRVAAPRVLPDPLFVYWPYSIDRARLLGYLISDGSYLKHRSISYVKADPVCVDEVVRIFEAEFGHRAKAQPARTGPAIEVDLTGEGLGPGSNRLINWLIALGIHGQRSPEKTIPDSLWSAPTPVVSAFLGCLWAGDGTITRSRSGRWSVKFSSTSERLAIQVQRLLLRVGVIAQVHHEITRGEAHYLPLHTVSILDRHNLLVFAAAIELPGVKGERLRRAAEAVTRRGENGRLDRFPLAVSEQITRMKTQRGLSWSTLGYRCQGKQIGRDDLARVADRLSSQTLRALAEAPIFWDQIASISPAGQMETFDFSAPTDGNALVSSLMTHNSGALEQDADLVCFLHRKDHRESGVTEFIIEKQRNGPTGTVNLSIDRDTQTFTDAGKEPVQDKIPDGPEPVAAPRPPRGWGRRR